MCAAFLSRGKMEWILNALHGVQDVSISSTSEPTASRDHTRPELKKLNDSVYELCKPSGSRARRPSVEIVFFHGLQFDTSQMTFLTTWLSKDGRESWLPWIFEYFPEARILVVSYNGCVEKKNKEGGPDMHITSENLWQDLIDARVGQDGCPVVLVGHSLGGLVMKEVLLIANSVLKLDPSKRVEEDLGFLLQNVKQLFYYSSPHNGTRLADIETKFVKGQLFEHLTVFNKEASRCNEAFRKLRHKYKWNAFSIVEALPTDLGQLGRHIVVEEASARYDTDDYYTAQDADHVNICRPESETDARFSKLKNVINQALAADVEGHKLRLSCDEVVGLDKQVELVRDKLEKSRQVGLFGPGGVGKTTLAELVYNDMSDNFEYTCFVSEVKGSVTKEASVEDLQAEILKNLYYKGRQIKKKGRESNFEWSRLAGKRVLIGLDDVEDDSQILSLTDSGFSKESCVLVTSRDRRLLRWNDFRVHHVEFLDTEGSKRLFCNHAFKNAKAPEAYQERVERFTQKCGGWPLILRVAGKYLYKQEQGVWDDAFDKLSQAKPLEAIIDKDEFWPIFKVIYGALHTTEQQMFLDIAICFHDEELLSVKRAWRVCRGFTDAGWQNLMDIGLVTTTIDTSSGDTNIQMHEVLRDLGRSIACPDPRTIQGHSHVCYHFDRGPWPFEQGNSKVEILKIVSGRGWRYPRAGPRRTIDTGKLRGLENLKALWLDGVPLHGTWKLLPAKLEFLQLKAGWISYEFDSLPSLKWKPGWLYSVVLRGAWNLVRAKLEFLKVTAGRVYQLGFFRHATLRHVEIDIGGNHSGSPRDTLHQLKALEYLSFGSCSSRDLPHSFKQHGALKHLRIGDYENTALPDSLGDLQALEHLEIGRSRLKYRLDSLGQFGALKSLTNDCYGAETISECLWHVSSSELDCSRFTTLPSTLGELSSLKSLTLSSFCGTALPSTLRQLRALESLTLIECHGLLTLSNSLGQLNALRQLVVMWCPRIMAFPETLRQLDGLRKLTIIGCERLRSLPDALGELQALSHLVIRRCHHLKALPPTLKELPGLQHFELEWYQESLKPLENILQELRPLEHFTLFSSHDPRAVQEALGQLDAVKHLNIWIGKDRFDRVGQEELGSGNYFEIIFCVSNSSDHVECFLEPLSPLEMESTPIRWTVPVLRPLAVPPVVPYFKVRPW